MNSANNPPSQSEPTVSQLEVNRVIRILKGEKLKFTVHLLMKNGNEYEFQTQEQPNVAYDDALREGVLRYDAGGCGYTTLCSWKDVEILRCEKNPT